VGIGAANRHAHCPTWLFQAIFALKIEVRAINNANYNTNDLVLSTIRKRSAMKLVRGTVFEFY
jgi:hypothetical protein